jgi:hypothetical protein
VYGLKASVAIVIRVPRMTLLGYLEYGSSTSPESEHQPRQHAQTVRFAGALIDHKLGSSV